MMKIGARASSALVLVSAFFFGCGGDGAHPVTPSATPTVASALPSMSDILDGGGEAGTAGKPGYSGLGASSVSSDLIAKYAAPPLPSEVSGRIQTMLDVRAPGAGALAEDGKTVFFSWNVTGVLQVWRLDGPQRFPVQMTGGEDATSIAGVMPDGASLVLSRDRKGEENPGLYLQKASGGPLTVIQHTPHVQTFLERIANDGASLYYRSNDRKPDSYVIYRYDIKSGKRDVVFDQDGLWYVADESDGKLLLQKQTGGTSSEVFEYDLGKKALTPLFGQGEKEDYAAVYGAAKGELIVRAVKAGDFYRLYRFRGGAFTPISPDVKFDVDELAIDEARKRVLYTVNEGGYLRAYGVDAATFKPIAMPPLPAADRTQVVGSTRDGRFTTFALTTARSPATSYVYEWKTGKLTQWALPSAPEVDTSHFAVAKLESYPARDGTKIPMFVRRPEKCAATPCPVIVSFHGGPESQTLAGFSPRAQIFVDAGFVYAEPNVRGSAGYGKTWLHADDGPKRLDVIGDIEDAAKYVKKAWAVDGKSPKVGIYGGSYGGYSTLIGMTMFAGAYDAGASVVGISNLVSFIRNTSPYRRILRISEYGDPDHDLDAMTKLSPITYVDKVRTPLLLVQGASDPRVPVGEALQMHDALVARGIDSPLILFPDEGHGSQRRENRVLELGHILAFFRKHLL